MYRLTKFNYDHKNVECDAVSVKRLMRNFLVEKGWHITLPVRSLEDDGKRTLAPAVSHVNYVYDECSLRAIMYYEKKNSTLRICYNVGDETKTVSDEDFIPALMAMLLPYKEQGCDYEQFAGRLIISKDGYWVDTIFIDHFRRLRNMNGEIMEQIIPN